VNGRKCPNYIREGGTGAEEGEGGRRAWKGGQRGKTDGTKLQLEEKEAGPGETLEGKRVGPEGRTG